MRISTSIPASVRAPAAFFKTRAGTLPAQPFDVSSLKLTVEPFKVADKAVVALNGRGLFSVSDNGILVYDQTRTLGNQQLIWVDRAGKLIEPAGALGNFESPKFSPDGKRVAGGRWDAQAGTLDICDRPRAEVNR